MGFCERTTRLFVEFVVGEQRGDVGRCLLREPGVVEDLWGEGVRAVVEHELSEVVGNGGCLDAEVAKHGVREPAAEELDGVAVDTCAEEGCSAARTEGARRWEMGRDACGALDRGGGVAQGVGDVEGLDRAPATVVAVVVAVHVDGLVRWSSGQFEASGDAPERLAWAEEGVVIRTVAHLFASDGILLVVEHEGGVADSLHGV